MKVTAIQRTAVKSRLATARSRLLASTAIGSSTVKVPGRIYGKTLGSFSAIAPGPLPEHLAKTFSGARYDEIDIDEEIVLYRIWHPQGAAGSGGAREFGEFWSLQKPASSIQARIDSAVRPEWGNPGTKFTTIRVPRGNVVYSGTAGYIGTVNEKTDTTSEGAWIGGGTQVIIKGGVKPEWKIEEGVLK